MIVVFIKICFSSDVKPHKIPHIGWNKLVRPHTVDSWNGTILEDTPAGANVYFVHSFTVVPESQDHRLADCYYDGCQFHPEKSGPNGLRILEAFLHITPTTS